MTLAVNYSNLFLTDAAYDYNFEAVDMRFGNYNRMSCIVGDRVFVLVENYTTETLDVFVIDNTTGTLITTLQICGVSDPIAGVKNAYEYAVVPSKDNDGFVVVVPCDTGSPSFDTAIYWREFDADLTPRNGAGEWFVVIPASEASFGVPYVSICQAVIDGDADDVFAFVLNYESNAVGGNYVVRAGMMTRLFGPRLTPIIDVAGGGLEPFNVSICPIGAANNDARNYAVFYMKAPTYDGNIDVSPWCAVVPSQFLLTFEKGAIAAPTSSVGDAYIYYRASDGNYATCIIFAEYDSTLGWYAITVTADSDNAPFVVAPLALIQAPEPSFTPDIHDVVMKDGTLRFALSGFDPDNYFDEVIEVDAATLTLTDYGVLPTPVGFEGDPARIEAGSNFVVQAVQDASQLFYITSIGAPPSPPDTGYNRVLSNFVRIVRQRCTPCAPTSIGLRSRFGGGTGDALG